VTVPPVTACPPEETFAVIVTIDPLTGPAEVAVSVVTVADCASATPDSNRRQKNQVNLRSQGIIGLSNLPRTNTRRLFRRSNINFLEYFGLTIKNEFESQRFAGHLFLGTASSHKRFLTEP
jgi:hypothetical protein